MANRTLETVQATKPAVVLVAGSFTGGGSSAATVTSGVGDWTVVGAGSGVYTITFADKFDSLIAFVASVGAAAPGDVDTYTITRDDYSASAGTLALTLSEAGTPTDLAASEYMDFVAVFDNTGA